MDNDFLSEDFLDFSQQPSPISKPRRKIHQVPERKKLFAAQKNIHKAIRELQNLKHDDKAQETQSLERYLKWAYNQLRTYLEDHTEAT